MSHQSFSDVRREEKGEHNYALYGIKQKGWSKFGNVLLAQMYDLLYIEQLLLPVLMIFRR